MSSKIILALLATGLLFNTINAQDLAQNIQKKKEACEKKEKAEREAEAKNSKEKALHDKIQQEKQAQK